MDTEPGYAKRPGPREMKRRQKGYILYNYQYFLSTPFTNEGAGQNPPERKEISPQRVPNLLGILAATIQVMGAGRKKEGTSGGKGEWPSVSKKADEEENPPTEWNATKGGRRIWLDKKRP